MKRRSAVPIIVAILLLLPILYVGTYCALVQRVYFSATYNGEEGIFVAADYRLGGSRIGRAALVFWPLEQIDQTLRPGAWEHPSFQSGSVSNLTRH
jgi:hypothetical protein